ncbi:hypothetical protein R6Q57_018093 [Mikania cordata]
MASEESIEVKFRLADGSDIGPNTYSPTITVGYLKEMILSQLPKDEANGPKTINDMKLINAGKILENHKTLAESRSPVSEVPGGIITMLVVMRPPMPDNNKGHLPGVSCANLVSLVLGDLDLARSLLETEQLSVCDSVTIRLTELV